MKSLTDLLEEILIDRLDKETALKVVNIIIEEANDPDYWEDVLDMIREK